MTKQSILLVGAGGHARACIDVIEQEDRFAVGGLVGRDAEKGTALFGYPVLGTDDELPELLRRYGTAIVAIGQIKSPELRIRLFDILHEAGASLPVIKSPRAYVSPHATVGAGSIVMHGAVINAGAVVGRNCIINSQALVEHDAMIGDHCHVATGAAINSAVKVGAETFIGSNTSVRQSISIGERCVIGMGQRIIADCPSGSQVPAREEG